MFFPSLGYLFPLDCPSVQVLNFPEIWFGSFFGCLCLGCPVQEIVAKLNVIKVFPCVFS